MTRGEAKGASTITMQTVKNLFLWNGRSFIRKGLEIPLAYVIDLVWSKSHILETYLNIAEFGEGIFGVEAASQHYFHTSARNLNAGQAALLAASLPNPLERNPAKPSHYVRAYANAIGARMGHDVPLECLK
jgi:monofunctional biosynthetic peptidoglycan transglycosylase